MSTEGHGPADEMQRSTWQHCPAYPNGEPPACGSQGSTAGAAGSGSRDAQPPAADDNAAPTTTACLHLLLHDMPMDTTRYEALRVWSKRGAAATTQNVLGAKALPLRDSAFS